MQVAVVMGSVSDKKTMQGCFDVLNSLGIEFTAAILSAHRTPAALLQHISDVEAAGCKVFVAAAGMAAHLAGVVAAHTLKPVIGVPLAGGLADGLDALLSTVQMPSGMPVATVAVGPAGAKNSAWLAAQILALHDDDLAARVAAAKAEVATTLQAHNAALQTELNG
jgi:5-(carboxyamino)imidazole ribonucleotide mutase